MTSDLLRLAERDGWTATRTNGGHLRLTHPAAAVPVFTASTPSDHRALQNALATMRRALPPEDKPAKPERPKRPKPKPRQIEQAVEWQRPPEPELPLVHRRNRLIHPVMAARKPAVQAPSGGRIRSGHTEVNLLNAPVH